MERQLPANQRRAIIGIIAVGVLVLSFALLAALINRQQFVNAGASGCPSLSGRVSSSLVSAHSTTSSSTATYYFDSLVDTSPSSGVPGLIAYCVYYSGSDPTGVTVSAVGADSTPFDAGTPPPSGSFSFNRGGGNSSNIPLDGTTTVMGAATWSGAVPAPTFLLHINDVAECQKLYGAGTSETCFVLPGSSSTPTPTATNTPTDPTATPTNTPPPGATPTPTNTPAGVPTPTPTIIPTPTGTPHPK